MSFYDKEGLLEVVLTHPENFEDSPIALPQMYN